MSFLGKLFGSKENISRPTGVVHAVHVDSDLNWSFDPSVDPKSQFTKLKVIGKGGFGTVSQIAHRPSMKTLAGKLINPTLVDESTRQEIEHEIQLMREVKSPYTIRYYGSVKYEGSLMILMEYCDRGSLRDILDAREQVLSEDQISVVMSDILRGLQILHTRHRIVHRDIKAANILLTAEGGIKIADFGVSRRFDSGTCQTMTIVGTPYWMAPEVISGVSYSFPADLWSVGITAVELAEGAPPYVELAPTKAMIEIAVKGFPGYRFRDMHSDEFCDFVSHCVKTDLSQRWTIEQLMQHPFIKRAERLPRAEVMADLLVPSGQRITEEGQEGPQSGYMSFGMAPSMNHARANLASAKPIDDSKFSGGTPLDFGSELGSSGSDLVPSGTMSRQFVSGDFKSFGQMSFGGGVNLPSARHFNDTAGSFGADIPSGTPAFPSGFDTDSFAGTAALMLQNGGGDSGIFFQPGNGGQSSRFMDSFGAGNSPFAASGNSGLPSARGFDFNSMASSIAESSGFDSFSLGPSTPIPDPDEPAASPAPATQSQTSEAPPAQPKPVPMPHTRTVKFSPESLRGAKGHQKLVKRQIPDIVYVKTARAMSVKIPFVGLKLGSMPEIDTSTIYKPYVPEDTDSSKGPLFDEEGVLNIQAALRNRASPPLLATLLVVFVFFFFGPEGFVALAALAFVTNLIVSHLRAVRRDRNSRESM